MNLIQLNTQLKKYFPKEKIIFGGSFVSGKSTNFSDIDVYIIFDGIYEFYQAVKDKNRLKKIKQELNIANKINLHLISKIFLRLGIYRIDGVCFLNDKTKKFFNQGDIKLWKLNCLKLSLKALILYKLNEEDINLAEKSFHDLQKNFKFLTGRDEYNLEKIENDLEFEAKKNKAFILSDWFFYCLRFKKIMPKNFEQIIINCLFALKRYVNTCNKDYFFEFFKNYKKLDNKTKANGRYIDMFKLIDKYVFLIFVI